MKLTVINTADGEKHFGFKIRNTGTRTLKLSCDINSQVGSALNIYGYSTTWKYITSVNVPPGESSPTLQKEISSEYTQIWCRLGFWGASVGSVIYTDNWCLKEI